MAINAVAHFLVVRMLKIREGAINNGVAVFCQQPEVKKRAEYRALFKANVERLLVDRVMIGAFLPVQ